jgi:DNA-binding IclR family transcriptional regulator
MAGNSGDVGRSVTSKVVTILQTFAQGDVHSLTEISCLTGLPISTVHRLAAELTAYGMLERTGDAHYRVGQRLRVLGGPDQHVPNLHERARSVLDDLAATTSTDVRLGVLNDVDVAFIEKVNGHRATSTFARAATVPAHATALGKALLAFSPLRTVDAVIAHGLKRYTAYTITSPERLRRSLAEIRVSCLAISRWEMRAGSCAVAAPVFGPGGRIVCALELKITELRTDLPRLAPALKIATRSLSRELTDNGRPAPASLGTAGGLETMRRQAVH